MTETARLADYVLPARRSSRSGRRRSSTSTSPATPSTSAVPARPARRPAARAGDPRPPVRGPRRARRDDDWQPRPGRSRAGGAAFADAFFAACRRPARSLAGWPVRGVPDARPDPARRRPRRPSWGRRPPVRCRPTPTASAGPGSGEGLGQPASCSTPSSRARRASSSPTTTRRPAGRAAHRRRACTSRCPGSSPSSTGSPPRRRRAPTPRAVRAVGRRAPVVHRQHDHPRLAWRRRDAASSLRVSPGERGRPARRRPVPG